MKHLLSAAVYLMRLLPVLGCLMAIQSWASDWSTTELLYQNGRLDAPTFAGGGTHRTTVFTLQHASGWKYGDNFFFIDHLNDGHPDGFDDGDFYGEIYLNFSLGKIASKQVGVGAIKDVGLIAGVNADADANVLKYLPGIRLSWDVPGFAFLNSDITAYIDRSDGVRVGTSNAPSEDNSYMIDISWAYPFSIGDYDFSIEGHMEYIGARTNEFGGDVSAWFLAQPQLRFDIGKAIANNPNQVFVGVKWQYWRNKLGDRDTDESSVMALLVWRL
jgi:nucleoside-specific outer membrane channel protein Tsx